MWKFWNKETIAYPRDSGHTESTKIQFNPDFIDADTPQIWADMVVWSMI